MYGRMLSALKECNVRLHPQTIMTDFERASINAFGEHFPDAILTGCFFHFGQCIWRRLQQFSDLQKQYKENADFAFKITKLIALSFVPPEDVVDAFVILSAEAFYSSSDNLVEFMDYFEETWIGQQRRNRRMEPFFAIKLWNCFHRVAEGIAKTNNALEGWHHGFHHMLGGDHPTVWRLIDGLKKQQSLNELRITQYQSGQAPPPSRKRYRYSAEKLRRVVESYGNMSIIDYLGGIANNLKLNV